MGRQLNNIQVDIARPTRPQLPSFCVESDRSNATVLIDWIGGTIVTIEQHVIG
jgi:hypothetical protein